MSAESGKSDAAASESLASGRALRTVSLITVSSLVQMVVLLALQLLVADLFGASSEVDAYLAALALPLVVSAILFGPVANALIPAFKECHHTAGEDAAESVLAVLAGGLISLGAVISLGMALGAEMVVAVAYPGFPAEQQTLTSELLRVLAWLVLINGTTSCLFGAFHCREWFLFPAASGVIGPVATVVWVAIGGRTLGIHGLAWATVGGGALGVLLLFYRLPRLRAVRRDALMTGLKRFGVLFAPLLIAAAFARLDPLIDRRLAAGLPEGSIAHLGYAWRLTQAAAQLTVSGLSLVAFPKIARHAMSGDHDRFARELAQAWRMLAALLIPVTIAILLFRDEIVRDVLERGAFLPNDTQAVAHLLVLYTGMIVAAGIAELGCRAFYALGQSRLPTIVQIAGVILGVTLKFTLVARWGVDALAGATSFYFAVTAIALVLMLSRYVTGALFAGLGGTCVRAVMASLVAAGLGGLCVWGGLPYGALIGAAIGLPVYVGGMVLLGERFDSADASPSHMSSAEKGPDPDST